MNTKTIYATFVLALVIGCDRPVDNVGPSDTTIKMNELPPSLDDITHAEHGPHGGELIEFGKEAFHGELLHGNEGVELFLLDSSAANPVAIPSESLTLSMKHDGEVKTFELAAQRDTGDPQGSSSHFLSRDHELGEWMTAGADGAIVVPFDGKTFTGKITHHHDHDHDHDDGHDHAGHSH